MFHSGYRKVACKGSNQAATTAQAALPPCGSSSTIAVAPTAINSPRTRTLLATPKQLQDVAKELKPHFRSGQGCGRVNVQKGRRSLQGSA